MHTPVIMPAQPEPAKRTEEPKVPIVKKEVRKTDPASLQAYAASQVSARWDSSQVESFKRVIHKESSWRHFGPHNGGSTAYGLAGFLNATWATVGCKKSSDPYVQIDCAIKYVADRYGTPNKAYAFHQKNNWY